METIPELEYDRSKSDANLAKHGIDFEQAQELWRDSKALMIAARDVVEARFALVGLIDGKHWTVVATMRGERIRIISARRSRAYEVRSYGRQENLG